MDNGDEDEWVDDDGQDLEDRREPIGRLGLGRPIRQARGRGRPRGAQSYQRRRQRYLHVWQLHPDRSPWLRPVLHDATRAQCIACNTEFDAFITTIDNHAASNRHEAAMVVGRVAGQQGEDLRDALHEEVARIKLILAIFLPDISCHSSSLILFCPW